MKPLRTITLLLLIALGVSTAVAQVPSQDNTQIDNTDNSYWYAEYFSHQYAAGTPTLTRNDSIVAFNWGQSSPDVTLPNDYFSAKWTRNFNVPVRSGYRFELEADDGARVWVDGKLVIDNWWKTPLVPTSLDLTLEAGNHNITVTYFENTGNAQIRFQFFPRAALSTDTWMTEYFNSPWEFTNPVFVHEETEIYHDWSYNAPAPGVNADNFGVRMQRLITVPGGPAELYRFTVRADDGVRIYVDDQLLIDGWTGQAWNPISADITLYPGTHTVRLEYYEASGYAFLEANYYKINELAQEQRSNPLRMLNHVGEVIVEEGVITSAPGGYFPLQPGQGVPGELYRQQVTTTGGNGSTAPGSSQTGNGGMHGDASSSVPGGGAPSQDNARYRYSAYSDETGGGVDIIDQWRGNYWAGRYPLGFGRFVTDIAVSGEYMYVAWTDDQFHGGHSCRGQIDIINVADPANPFRIAVIDNPGYAHSVFIKEGVLYTLWGCSSGEWARNTSQLRMYDLDPFQPIQLGQYQLLLPDQFIPFYLHITEARGYVWVPYDNNKWAVFR